MNVSGFFKQLKKRLRIKRRWLSLGVWMMLAGSASGLAWLLLSNESNETAREMTGTVSKPVVSRNYISDDPARQQAVLDTIKSTAGEFEVYLQKNYVCGEEIKQLGRMSSEKILEIYRENPHFFVNVNNEGHVFFVERIEDLSPQCKENAYFGLDRNGNLTLFDGVPDKENVMRTFFQLNIERLESSLPRETVQQLREGIRVTDLAEYNSVLSTFSDYAVEETEKVMKPKS